MIVLTGRQDSRKRARMAEVATARRPFLYLIVGMFTVIAAWGYVASLQSSLQAPWTTDFMRLTLASTQMLAGQDPYSAPLAEAEYLQQITSISRTTAGRHETLESPTVLLLLAPFAHLEAATAFLIWVAISVLAGIASLLLIEERLGGFHTDTNLQAGPHRFALLLSATIFFYPTWVSLVIGQTGFVTLLFLTLGWGWARDGRDERAGFALGLAVSLMPALIVLAFYLLSLGRLRILATAILATLVGLFIPAVIIDIAVLQGYFTALGAVNWFGAGWNGSLVGFLAPLFGNSANAPLIEAAWLTPLLILAATIFALRALWKFGRMVTSIEQKLGTERAKPIFDQGFALCLPLALLLSPLGWLHNFVLLLPAFCIGLEACARRPRDWRWRERILLAWILCAMPYPVLRAENNDSLIQWFGYPAFDTYALIILAVTIAGLCQREASALLRRSRHLSKSKELEPPSSQDTGAADQSDEQSSDDEIIESDGRDTRGATPPTSGKLALP
ncbi:glycosyltransferase family 87 protein [Limibacillus sp. MBR-115]|uniref:glycosyltransferase family 87 protein n=1 Tax=Limibacillus sp. MBR-115 TaxID=3156465 RepID=UPI003398EC5C